MNSRTRRLALLLTTVAVTVVAGCTGQEEPSAESDPPTTACPPPELAVSSGQDTEDPAPSGPVQVAAGSITISGARFGVDCSDEPIEGVRIVLVQGEQESSLAQVNADDDLAFGVVVGLPESTQPGPAEIIARRSLDEDAEVLASTELVITAP